MPGMKKMPQDKRIKRKTAKFDKKNPANKDKFLTAKDSKVNRMVKRDNKRADKINDLQDKKNYKSKAAMKDGQDTLNTMQPRKGGIYMDREDGKLPMDRVGKYYQDTNPKMEQIKRISLDDKGYVGRDMAGSANELIDVANKGIKKVQGAVSKNPIPRMDISKSGYVGRSVKSSANELIDAANKGLNYLTGKK